MKKYLAVILTLVFVFSLAACGGDEEQKPDDNSSDNSSSEEMILEGGIEIPYSAVMDGYIDHNGKWEVDYKPHASFQCMTDEVLFLPKGTTIMSNKKVAIYCYRVGKDELIYNIDRCKELGQEVNDLFDIQHNPITIVLEDDCLVRLSVKGKLTDVAFYAPEEIAAKIKLMTVEEAYQTDNVNIK
jgi:hypothetical protein